MLNVLKGKKTGDHLYWLGTLVVLTLIPRLYFANHFLYDGDPVAYYLGAENLLAGHGYTAMGAPVIWPIGCSLTIVPFLLIGGGVIAGTASSVLFSMLAVIALYFIGERLFSKAVGFTAALMLGYAEAFFFNSVNVASDTQALFFLLTAVYVMLVYLENGGMRRVFLIGLFTGMAVITRYSAASFTLLPVALYIIRYRKEGKIPGAGTRSDNLKVILFFAFGLAIPGSVQVVVNYVSWGSVLPVMYIKVNAAIPSGNPFNWMTNGARIIYRLFLTVDFYAPFATILLPVGIFRLKEREGRLQLLALWGLVALFPLIGFYVKPRFLLPFMPPIFLIMAAGGMYIFESMSAHIFRYARNRNAVKVAVILIFMLTAVPFIATSFRNAEFIKIDSEMMAKAFEWVHDNTDAESAVMTQSTYFGHFNVWEATGVYVWASKYYGEREMYSLTEDPGEILTVHSEVYLVMNDYWQRRTNLTVMYPARDIERMDSIFSNYTVEEVASFPIRESSLLWKLRASSKHPDYYFTEPVSFKVYRILGEDGKRAE